MQAPSRKLRLGAALVALATTSSIVWAMSSYAYPQAPQYTWGEMARMAILRACTS